MILKADEQKVLTLKKYIPTSEAASYAVTFARLFSAIIVSLTIEGVIGRSIIVG